MSEVPVDWLESILGHRPLDPALYAMALTHSSHSAAGDYQRLEFLGDRVLGVTVAAWLYRLFPGEPEGKLSRRFNALVAGGTCAGIARTLGIPKHLRLGKQARDDGASDSDNVLGDVVEALIGALFLEGGLSVAERFIHRAWGGLVETQDSAPKHPKSALQEWAAAHRYRGPAYTLVSRSGPHHAPVFVVKVEIPGRAEASAEGSSKQEAETAAAEKLLAMLA
ncbi:ribonuclease III [Flavisphingomonas formosensis]|uniref:ribonuclease III n=1 Tax=Flavisphingomonas formosensis TaxID=861534 RepID=UPI001E4986B9|nr:ribonuclease III [Sphingomonas formosensis]